ncbi:MAG: cytochrome C [Hyphomicrobiales bacterium]|nr:MAG: cytochrome C [Hyphomicrobiales bacterium]
MATIASACVLGLSLWTFTGQDAEAIALKPDNEKLRNLGNKVYGEYCAACHGIDLKGQPNWKTPLANGRYPAPPHNKDGHTWHHPDELLFRLTKFGPAEIIGNGHESDMPGFKDQLSDEEIIAVLSYIKSTWPKIVRIRHDRLNESASMQKGSS